MRIVDEQGRDVPPGEIGEIYLRGPLSPTSPTTTTMPSAARSRCGDLVTVGDVGYQDADGYLFLCDRKRDMIISGGVNIYPAEIEVGADPDAGRARLRGVRHSRRGVRRAALRPCRAAGRRGDRALGVRAFLGQHVARYKVPKVVEFSAALPREDSGKIFKRKLRAPYWEKAGRSI